MPGLDARDTLDGLHHLDRRQKLIVDGHELARILLGVLEDRSNCRLQRQRCEPTMLQMAQICWRGVAAAAPSKDITMQRHGATLAHVGTDSTAGFSNVLSDA